MSEKEATTGEELHEENNVEQSTESTEDTGVEQDPVAKLEDEVKDLKDQNLRLYAEFENFRRRTAKGASRAYGERKQRHFNSYAASS